MPSARSFSAAQLAVIDWAAIECRRQRSNELSVSWMLHAWQYAMRVTALPIELDVLAMGALVEPYVNARGYRQCGVRVGNDVKLDWRQVPRAMENLLEAVERLDPDEWFYQYENIHPFRDGNGRTGAILYNWLRKSLGAPIEPPECWGPREEVRL